MTTETAGAPTRVTWCPLKLAHLDNASYDSQEVKDICLSCTLRRCIHDKKKKREKPLTTVK